MVKIRDLIKRLEAAGYRKLREGSDHTIYGKEDSRRISVPRHREINENTAEAILKQAGLK